MNEKNKDVFDEAYTIKGSYQNKDGIYTPFEETQIVEVKHGVNEKNNHNKALEQFVKDHHHLKNLEIHSVIYQ